MASLKDIEYYTRRAEEASRLAREASNPTVRVIHRKMAGSYERLAGLHDLVGSTTRP